MVIWSKQYKSAIFALSMPSKDADHGEYTTWKAINFPVECSG